MRSLDRPLSLLPLAGLTALALTACSSATDAAAPPSTTVTATATKTATASPTGSASPSSTTGPTTPAEPDSCAKPFEITVDAPTVDVAGVTAIRAETSVTGLCGEGSTTLQNGANDVATQRFRSWSDSWEKLAAEYPQGPAGEFEQKARVAVDQDGIGVVVLDTYVYSGGAHGNTLRDVAAVDAGTGEAITVDSMLAEMQQAGGPGWNFERELRRAAAAAVDTQPVTDLTRESISAYPTREGLAVSMSQGAYFATAQGVVEFTIPWDRLVGDGEDMSFVPDAWGY